jgi:hypothetical protein
MTFRRLLFSRFATTLIVRWRGEIRGILARRPPGNETLRHGMGDIVPPRRLETNPKPEIRNPNEI